MPDYRARLNRLEETIAPSRRVRYVFVKRGQPMRQAIDTYVAKGRLTPAEVEASVWIGVRWMEPGEEMKIEDNADA